MPPSDLSHINLRLLNSLIPNNSQHSHLSPCTTTESPSPDDGSVVEPSINNLPSFRMQDVRYIREPVAQTNTQNPEISSVRRISPTSKQPLLPIFDGIDIPPEIPRWRHSNSPSSEPFNLRNMHDSADAKLEESELIHSQHSRGNTLSVSRDDGSFLEPLDNNHSPFRMQDVKYIRNFITQNNTRGSDTRNIKGGQSTTLKKQSTKLSSAALFGPLPRTRPSPLVRPSRVEKIHSRFFTALPNNSSSSQQTFPPTPSSKGLRLSRTRGRIGTQLIKSLPTLSDNGIIGHPDPPAPLVPNTESPRLRRSARIAQQCQKLQEKKQPPVLRAAVAGNKIEKRRHHASTPKKSKSAAAATKKSKRNPPLSKSLTRRNKAR